MDIRVWGEHDENLLKLDNGDGSTTFYNILKWIYYKPLKCIL